MSMAALSEPSVELAAKILSEVADDQQLGGYRMTAGSGPTFFALHSLEAAVNLLGTDSIERLLSQGNRGSLGYIDPGVLKRWVDEVFGDHELAVAIGLEIDAGESYADRVGPIRALLAERLQQCRDLTEQPEQAEGDEGAPIG